MCVCVCLCMCVCICVLVRLCQCLLDYRVGTDILKFQKLKKCKILRHIVPILIIFCLFVRYFFLLKSTEVCLFYSSLSYSLFSVWEKFLLCCVYFRMSSFSLSNSVKPYFFQEKLKVGCLYLLLVDMPLICLLLMM